MCLIHFTFKPDGMLLFITVKMVGDPCTERKGKERKFIETFGTELYQFDMMQLKHFNNQGRQEQLMDELNE
jgi:hypothetical protein